MMCPMIRPTSIPARDLAVAVGAPLALLALVYGLWAVLDAAVRIGPFDRATLGWATVMPLWFASPWLAAMVWRRLPRFGDRAAAASVGLALGAAATWILWSTVVTESVACDFGPRSTGAAFVGPALFLGVLVGGGWAISALAASSLTRSGHPWRGLAAAVGLGAAQFGLVAIAATYVLFAYAGCNRPS
jgi:hypothetical protein